MNIRPIVVAAALLVSLVGCSSTQPAPPPPPPAPTVCPPPLVEASPSADSECVKDEPRFYVHSFDPRPGHKFELYYDLVNPPTGFQDVLVFEKTATGTYNWVETVAAGAETTSTQQQVIGDYTPGAKTVVLILATKAATDRIMNEITAGDKGLQPITTFGRGTTTLPIYGNRRVIPKS